MSRPVPLAPQPVAPMVDPKTGRPTTEYVRLIADLLAVIADLRERVAKLGG